MCKDWMIQCVESLKHSAGMQWMDIMMIMKTLRQPWKWDTVLSPHYLELFILDF